MYRRHAVNVCAEANAARRPTLNGGSQSDESVIPAGEPLDALTVLCVAPHRRTIDIDAASGKPLTVLPPKMNAVEAAKMLAELPAGTVIDVQAGGRHVGLVWPPGKPKTALGEPSGWMTVGRLA